MTLSDIQDRASNAGLSKVDFSYSCAAGDTISTGSAFAITVPELNVLCNWLVTEMQTWSRIASRHAGSAVHAHEQIYIAT